MSPLRGPGPLAVRRWVQRGTICAALACIGYLAWRFDGLAVPAGVDPAFGLRAGERLVLDRSPRGLYAGDYVVVVDPSGARNLVRIEELSPAGPHVGRDAAGAICEVTPASVLARVILVWPY